jgi:hypothetical protein
MIAHVGAYSAYASPPCEIAALRFVDLVQIQILGLVNHLARRDRRSRSKCFHYVLRKSAED